MTSYSFGDPLETVAEEETAQLDMELGSLDEHGLNSLNEAPKRTPDRDGPTTHLLKDSKSSSFSAWESFKRSQLQLFRVFVYTPMDATVQFFVDMLVVPEGRLPRSALSGMEAGVSVAGISLFSGGARYRPYICVAVMFVCLTLLMWTSYLDFYGDSEREVDPPVSNITAISVQNTLDCNWLLTKVRWLDLDASHVVYENPEPAEVQYIFSISYIHASAASTALKNARTPFTGFACDELPPSIKSVSQAVATGAEVTVLLLPYDMKPEFALQRHLESLPTSNRITVFVDLTFSFATFSCTPSDLKLMLQSSKSSVLVAPGPVSTLAGAQTDILESLTGNTQGDLNDSIFELTMPGDRVSRRAEHCITVYRLD
ncbi:hypothetical protein BJ742DRAFT_739474 [Cladochytrium replicatum]|nr:hypothetical protein BJ742DRAFT_739474 [Cladochytrium replicatum]